MTRRSRARRGRARSRTSGACSIRSSAASRRCSTSSTRSPSRRRARAARNDRLLRAFVMMPRCVRAGIRLSFVLLSVVLLFSGVPRAQQRAAGGVPTPEAHFGFRMGADGYLAPADAIEKYFELVAAAIGSRQGRRSRADDRGPPDGRRDRPAPENIRNLDQIRATTSGSPIRGRSPPEEARRHRRRRTRSSSPSAAASTRSEVGGTQAANELSVRRSRRRTIRDTLDQLRNVVVIIIPMLNPDGHRLVVDWYNKYKSTPFEGGPMPWLDHKYAGHDINRDAFMMNLAESRNLARFFYTRVASAGVSDDAPDGRRRSAVLRAAEQRSDRSQLRSDHLARGGPARRAMTLELERDEPHRRGVEQPVRLLLAGLRGLRAARPQHGLSADRGGRRQGGHARLRRRLAVRPPPPQIDAPHPWPGGPWPLRDIVDYDLSAMHGLLRAAAAYRGELVRSFYDMGRRAIEAGVRAAPFAFVIPPEQHDRARAPEARRTAARWRRRDSASAGAVSREQHGVSGRHRFHPAGAAVPRVRQDAARAAGLPRRPHGTGQRPYDATGWTLPAQMGVDVRTVERPFELPLMSRVTTSTPPRLPRRRQAKSGARRSPATTSWTRAARPAHWRGTVCWRPDCRFRGCRARQT